MKQLQQFQEQQPSWQQLSQDERATNENQVRISEKTKTLRLKANNDWEESRCSWSQGWMWCDFIIISINN